MSHENYISHDAGYYSALNDYGGARPGDDADSAIGDTESFRRVLPFFIRMAAMCLYGAGERQERPLEA